MAKRSRKSLAEQVASLAGAREARLPSRVEPALAEPVPAPPVGEKWVHEIKLDGYRMLCRKDGQEVQFLSRNNQDWTRRFASLATEAAGLQAETALLDGEVVVTLPDGRTSFQALQNALSSRTDTTVYYAFDLLYLDGYDLRSVKLEARKDMLQRLISGSGLHRIMFCDHIAGKGPEVLEQASQMGVEGIISKRRDHPYRKGRTSSWKKVKCLQSDDFLIGGYTKPAKAEYGIGALLLGQYDKEGRLVYAGRVGTGFSEATRSSLKDALKRSTVPESPFLELPAGEGGKGVSFVEPSLVAHVEYLERTGENSLLRHAVFRGLREDVVPEEVTGPFNEGPARAPPPPALPAGVEKLPEIRFTHPDKLVFPEAGITKVDLARYYLQVGEWMLPHVQGRPLSLVRCPEGVDKQCFYQKAPPAGLPDFVKRFEVPSSEEGSKDRMVVDDLAGLLSLVQIYAVEIHTWGARADRLDRPDRLVFDLDPHESVAWQRVTAAALDLRSFLEDAGLESFVSATGGKGLHIVVPIARRYGWEKAKAFSHEVARRFAATRHREFTTSPSLSSRSGKIYIDYLRNRRGATFIAPYSTRARAGAPVAVPLDWAELSRLRSAAEFDVHSVPARLARRTQCPWSDLDSMKQRLPRLR